MILLSCATTKQTEDCLCGEERVEKTADAKNMHQEPVYSDDDFFSPLEEIRELLSIVVEDKFVNGGRTKVLKKEGQERKEEYPPNKHDPHPL